MKLYPADAIANTKIVSSVIVKWLKTEGIYDRTVILFTSDHGEQFWEHGASLHGHTLYEEEIRIPLILLAMGFKSVSIRCR